MKKKMKIINQLSVKSCIKYKIPKKIMINYNKKKLKLKLTIFNKLKKVYL
jgi:hypothetical protein